MKSPDPVDAVRLEVESAHVTIPNPDRVLVTVVFSYEPWEPSRAQDPLREQARALDCVRGVLERGGLERW